MARDNLTAEKGGFVDYGPEQLDKVNTIRRDKSQPDFYGIPILTDDEVLLTSADELGGHPASCYTCKEHTSDFTCKRLGPGLSVKKVIGNKDYDDPIEYWPCCSLQEYTDKPREGKIQYHDLLDTPDEIGLIWINAPKVGQAFGGANCGGVDGGDDCDRYRTRGKVEKWDTDQGICTVLQHVVEAGAVCTAWHDDDELTWREAQQLINGKDLGKIKKESLVKGIMGRDDNEK